MSVSAFYQFHVPAIVRTIPYIVIWWLQLAAAAGQTFENVEKCVRNWPAKRMEKLNYSKKEKLLSSNSSTTFIFRVVQFFQFVWLVGRQLLTPCEIFALK